jgi:hypothetical protein
MSDILQTVLNGISKRLKDMGDGTYAEVVYNAGGGGGSGGASELHIGEVGGRTIIAAAGLVRPADTDAYAVGDLIANATGAASVAALALAAGRINGGTGMIRRARLAVNDTAWAGAIVRVHFYKSSPTVANGDNGAWASSESDYLGCCDVSLDKSFSDPAVKGIGAPACGAEINFACDSGSQNIYALLEARSAVTPAAGAAFSLAAEILAN